MVLVIVLESKDGCFAPKKYPRTMVLVIVLESKKASFYKCCP